MITKKINPKINKLLKILNDEAFHDGSSLGQALGVSRTAIWKFIAQLEKYGIAIESVKGKGYRLAAPLMLLEAKEIKKNLSDASLKKKIKLDIFSEINSTNDYLHDKILKNLALYICLAEMQHQGRGRLSRQWFSPFGRNIYFSCLCEFKKDIGELGGLSLIVSIAIVKTLRDLNIHEGISIKWPNDVMFKDLKLAGTLIEIFAETHGTAKVIIGVGINVNMTHDILSHIPKPCTSLKEICQKNIDRNLLVARLIMHLNAALSQFAESSQTQWQQEWQQYDYLKQKKISILNHQQEIIGTALGINDKGFLLLQHLDGTIKAYSSGDASIVT